MDEEYRKQAQRSIQRGEDILNLNSTSAIEHYKAGIEFYKQIVSKTQTDLLMSAKAYYFLASAHFNKKQYEQAINAYSNSINELLKTTPNDTVSYDTLYRTLVKRYIDLADAYLESSNQYAAQVVITNAKKAFNLIQEKSPNEKSLGDPDVNFEAFHNFYEQQLSEEHYLKSARFRNNQEVINNAEEEQRMLRQFNAISMENRQQVNDELTNMLNGLSMQLPTFTPVPVINHMPDDIDHRNLAQQYIAMARAYIQKNEIDKAVKTYEQAINSLKLIQNPSTTDMEIVQSLQRHKAALSIKSPTPQQYNLSFSMWASGSDIWKPENEDDMDIEPCDNYADYRRQ